MFFINTRSPFRKREFVLLHIMPTAFVVCVLLAVSISGWTYAKRSYERERLNLLQQTNKAATEQILKRFMAYEDILNATASLFSVKGPITRDDWSLYASHIDIMNRYPGVRGLGYAHYIEDAQLPEFIQESNQLGLNSFSVFPSGTRDAYAPILYFEPASIENSFAIGFDMLSETSRRNALLAAKETGNATLTSVVSLIQRDEQQAAEKSGFLLYYPIYESGNLPSISKTRSENLQGFVYIPFRSKDFIEHTLNPNEARYAFVITDSFNSDIIYKSENYDSLSTGGSFIDATQSIGVAGANWQLTTVAPRNISVAAVHLRPNIVLYAGVISSILIGTLMYILMQNRARSLVQTEEQAIQNAKDELLALASHQLRTPATGVKQYIGMLREGLAGRLTNEQYSIVEKAYQSNERQLSTINEMLFVARTDAGHLKMDKSHFDYKKLVLDVIDEQRLVIEKKQQRLKTYITKKPIKIKGDVFYLRMAIENILSNATKYTPNNGRIYVSLRIKGSTVLLKIQDSGVGVDKKDQELLFQKFSRIPNEMSGSTSGSGIGLYLARNVVENHFGTIGFASNTGKGSIVQIILPLKKSPKSKRTSTSVH